MKRVEFLNRSHRRQMRDRFPTFEKQKAPIFQHTEPQSVQMRATFKVISHEYDAPTKIEKTRKKNSLL